MKRLAYLVAIFALLITGFATVQAQGNRPDSVATHIIVFNNNARVNVPQFAQANGVEAKNVYSTVLNGFSAVVPAGRLNALQRNPNVAYVFENEAVELAAQGIPTGIQRTNASNQPQIDGVNDLWVDVDVAVVDTGIDLDHPDLNVVGGVDCTSQTKGKTKSFVCGSGGNDDNYHGTHVAGTIAALDNGIGVVGVAPGARLWAVKVLDSNGSGYMDAVIAGMDWVTAQGNIEVMNISLTTSLSTSGALEAYTTAVNNAVANGVIVVAAAGNFNTNAANYGPAVVPSAITVSAIADFNGVAGGGANYTCRADVDDTLADFSNFGSVIDIAAPGVCILSTSPNGNYMTLNGTSMAAPHVAGAAALLASGSNAPSNGADVTAIRNAIVNNGKFDFVDDSGDGIQEPSLDVTGFTATWVNAGTSVEPTPDPTPDPTPEPEPTSEPKPCRGKNCK